MKRHILLFFVLLFSLPAEAQKDTTKAKIPDSLRIWKRGGAIAINFNQTNLSNWAAGGQNSIATNALLNLFINYKKEKTSWDNSAELGYGFLRSGFRGPLFKSDDKIDLTSKWGHLAFYKVHYSALVNFKSQFTKGYNYPNDSVVISDFLAPGYLLGSIGMDYKPHDNLSLYLSPVTGKFTFVNRRDLADAGEFGVEPAEVDSSGNIIRHGDRVRKEFGAYMTFKYKKKLWESIVFSTKLDLFSNYFNHPENIDVNWDMLLNMKVNKYIAVSVSTTLIYDHDVNIPIYQNINGVDEIIGYGPRTQFREVLAVGFNMKF
jgi:hypothetical protein